MIFSDQHVIVCDKDGTEIGGGIWSDELDALAMINAGYAVVVNSDPAMVLADYRGHYPRKLTPLSYHLDGENITLRMTDDLGFDYEADMRGEDLKAIVRRWLET